MQTELAIFLLVIAAVIGLICYAWKRRRSALARGIGAAGASYNELCGQGQPPRVPPPPEQKRP
jgi:hypothetical protein